MNHKNLKLEAPWESHKKMLHAMFDRDPDIEVGEVGTSKNPDFQYFVPIEVRNHDKFVALTKVLKTSLIFGNVKMEIVLYDVENEFVNPYAQIYQTLFEGNSIVKDIQTASDITGTPIVYVRFQPEVIQYFDDNMSDFSGNRSCLAQDIANEIFDNNQWSLHFCTASLNEEN